MSFVGHLSTTLENESQCRTTQNQMLEKKARKKLHLLTQPQ